MPRLPLILCAIALVATACSAVFYLQLGSTRQGLEMRLADANARATQLDTRLAAAHEQTGSLKAQVASLGTELERTSAKVAAAEARRGELERDVAQARADVTQTRSVLALYESTAKSLAEELTTLRKDLTDTRASNASPTAVQAYKDTIMELERQLAAARAGTAAPGGPAASTAVLGSRAGRATVLTVGPENAFVVLNFGSARGATLGQTLAVNQGTDVIATVLISDVRTNYSVAQVLPDTLRGVLQKGDSAILVR